MKGEWSTSLELPSGYQNFSWFRRGENVNEIFMDEPDLLINVLNDKEERHTDLYLYTHHEVFFNDYDPTAVLQHTRSSPNWEGGLVTYATCKHLMRCYNRTGNWRGVWLAGLCPAHCARNTVMYVGKVAVSLYGNYALRSYVSANHLSALTPKMADTNPRGDLYTPRRLLAGAALYRHENFYSPPNHTRSVEMYKRSPGSVSEREDGKIPKWWRDIEYTMYNRRPPTFVLAPCFLFSKPALWAAQKPRRAVLRLRPGELAAGLRKRA